VTRSARAVACSNIALAKYWGKLPNTDNRTAVPSLSLTLAELRTTTVVSFDDSLRADEGTLDGKALAGRPLLRVSKMLDQVRALAESPLFARVESHNDFPTAAGLASSASGFAALALAASRASGLTLPLGELSSLARAASASAARSLFGGYVTLAAGAASAEPLLAGAAFPLEMLVAVTAQGAKATASTDGMTHTASTSPYYAAWLERAPALYEEVRSALLQRDFDALGPAVEQSALMMHASMLAARPALIYFAPATLRVIERVRELRAHGARAYFTIDAGPHVKVLVEPDSAEQIAAELARTDGVARVLRATPGPDAQLVES
jgi:diphosphomevalonate decarboxylase